MSVTRNIAANYLGRAYAIGSIYLFTPFYIRYLGIEAYGIVAFYAIILAFGALFDAGLTATFSREVARSDNPKRLLDLLTTVERTLIGATLLFAAAVYLAAPLIAAQWFNDSGAISQASIVGSIRLMALCVPPQLAISLYIAGLLGMQRQGVGNALQALYVTLRGGLVIPALAWNPSLELFFAWQFATNVLMMVVARAVLVRGLGFGSFALGRASFAVLRPALGFAGGMFALTVLAALNTQLDKLAVSKLFTIEQFGLYTLAATLAQIPYALVSPLMLAMLPRATELITRGREAEAGALYDRFVGIVALLGGTSAFGLIFFAPEVLALWLRIDPMPPAMVDLVRILTAGSLMLSIASTPFYLGLAHGHNRTSVLTNLLTLIVTIPLLVAGTALIGLAGAALPWVVLNTMAFAVLSWNIHRRFYRGYGRPTLATVAMVAISAAVAGIARLIASAFQLSPLAACALAGTICGTFLVWMVRRDRNGLPITDKRDDEPTRAFGAERS